MNPTDDARRLADLSRAVRESTLKRLRRVPEGKENWRVAPGRMSFADIAFHLAEADRWLRRKMGDPGLPGMEGGVGCPRTRQEYDSLLRDLVETGEERAALLRGMTDGDLARMIHDDRFGGEVSAWWVIVRGNLDHEIHHRGQVSAYLQVLR